METFSSSFPSSFQILGHTYKIKLVKRVDEEGNRGEVDFENKVIRIQKPTKGYSYDMALETLYHEISHIMLDEMEYSELSKDETLIERLGRSLHQVIRSMK